MFMIAYVLSGGNLRGGLQVGALQALLADPARKPQMIVGSSIGAINGALVAADPTSLGVERLAHIWRNVKRSDIYPGTRVALARRVLRGKDSLYTDKPLRTICQRAFPPGVISFGDLKIPLYVTVATLNSHTWYYWGDDRRTRLIDAIVASASLPGVFPPIAQGDYQYVDGGLVANLPLQVAIEKGATEIYALDVSFTTQQLPRVKGVPGILGRTVQVMLHQQTRDELERVIGLPSITLHHIQLNGFKALKWGDFSQTSAMIDYGRRQTEEYLRQPAPNTIRQSEVAPPPPPGAVRFTPRLYAVRR